MCSHQCAREHGISGRCVRSPAARVQRFTEEGGCLFFGFLNVGKEEQAITSVEVSCQPVHHQYFMHANGPVWVCQKEAVTIY